MTDSWTAQQIIEAFPEETAPCFLLRDRDQIYGEEFRRRVAGMRIEEVMTALHCPWQSPYVERLIGSIRRECLNRVMRVFPQFGPYLSGILIAIVNFRQVGTLA